MKLEWYEKYNCHSAKVGRFSINVNWSTDRAAPGYKVSFNDVRLKSNISDLTEAKNTGIRLAKRVLTEALDVVNSIEEETKES